MEARVIEEELSKMAACRGVRACALVDSESGLVLQVAGSTIEKPATWEAAVDYWRAHFRLRSYFQDVISLGPIGAIAVYHTGATIAVVPCKSQNDLVVICIGHPRKVDWGDWQRRVRQLDQTISRK